MSQRGIVFSIVALSLGMLILLLSFVANHNLQASEANLQITASSQKAVAVFENVEENIFEIMENVAGIRTTVGERGVVFAERIPDKQSKAEFDKSIEIYKMFVLSQFRDVDLNINNDKIHLSTLNISPHLLTYSHSIDAKKWGENRQVVLAPVVNSGFNRNGYVVDIFLVNQSYLGYISDFRTCISCIGIDLNLNVIGLNGVVQLFISQLKIDPSKTSSVIIKTTGLPENDIVLKIGEVTGLGSGDRFFLENKNLSPIDVAISPIADKTNISVFDIKLPANVVVVEDKITGFRKNQ